MKRIIKSRIPGVHFLKSKSGSYKWIYVIHEASGLPLYYMRDNLTAKDAEFMAAMEKALEDTGLDFTVSAKQLNASVQGREAEYRQKIYDVPIKREAYH